MHAILRNSEGITAKVTSKTLEEFFPGKGKSSILLFDSNKDEYDVGIMLTNVDTMGSHITNLTPLAKLAVEVVSMLQKIPRKQRSVTQIKVGLATLETFAQMQEENNGKKAAE